MINKISFKLYLGMLGMLMGLTGCGGEIKKEVEPNISFISNNNIEVQQQPTTYLLVGFAGLGDSGTHPENWLGKIKEMIQAETSNFSIKPQVLQLLIRRSSENMTIEEHENEANQQILGYLLNQGLTDFNNVKVIMVAESYGGLVATQCGLNNFNGIGIHGSGLITIRTPYEGVSLVQVISVLMPYAQQLNQQTPGIAAWLNVYANCQQALTTLNPNSPFITGLKNGGLSNLNFPILALAGRDTQPTFPYQYLQGLPLLVFVLPQLSQQILQVSSLLVPYQSGNDGLVTTNSATAANSMRGLNFVSHVFNDFSHFGNTTNHDGALSPVRDLIRRIVR